MGVGWGLIPISCKQTSSNFQIDKPLNPPFTPVPLTRKGCFCLTGSEIHLPTYVPCNIPLHTASQQFPNHQPVSPFLIRSRFFSAPSLSPPHKVQPEQEIRCSSIAHLVHKTCVQGQASGLKKISTFWRSACGSSLSKGSIFFATLAHTASTLSSCAPIHFAPIPRICNVIGFKHPTAFPITASLRSLRLVLIAAWLLVLLHNARSILTRGYSCPLKSPIRYSLRSFII